MIVNVLTKFEKDFCTFAVDTKELKQHKRFSFSVIYEWFLKQFDVLMLTRCQHSRNKLSFVTGYFPSESLTQSN